jgi:acetyl CoA:N6-hydroxylysine acetyl transferase
MGQLHEQGLHLSARATSFICRPDRTVYLATLDGSTLLLKTADGIEKSRWQLDRKADQLTLGWLVSHSAAKPATVELLAAIEAAFFNYPDRHQLHLQTPFDQADELLRSGLLLGDENGKMAVNVELFWQQSRMWVVPLQPYAFPVTYVLSQ